MLKKASIGRVIRSNGLWYQVLLENNNIVECRLKGRMRLQYDAFTNPVAVGDYVELENEGNSIVIANVRDRKNYIVRESPSKRHLKHVIASNIDQAILVLTIRAPNLKRGFIDRFLINCEMFHIPAILVFNKLDIYTEKDLEVLDEIAFLYEKMNYKVMAVSAEKKINTEAFEELIQDKTTLISGNSGVGKSTLLNLLMKNEIQRTNDLSKFTGKGMHTTTFVEMFNVSPNTYIVDSPGIKEFDVIHLEPQEVGQYMRDISHFAHQCSYSNCTHIHEPNCAVKNAVENGEIDEIRYQNYAHITDIIAAKNYWERK